MTSTAPAWVLASSVLLLWLLVIVWPGSRTVADYRLVHVLTRGSDGATVPRDRGGSDRAGVRVAAAVSPRRAAAFAALAGAATVALIPSVTGGVVAVVDALAAYLMLRRPWSTDVPNAEAGGAQAGEVRAGWRWLPRRTDRSDPGLALAVDLIAVCLRSGMGTASALREVARTLSTSAAQDAGTSYAAVARMLARVAAASELGSDPSIAWADWMGDPRYGRLARALVVTGESGSAVAGRLEVVSRQLRGAEGQRAVDRANQLGVFLMAPLGLCFLPAFICLGVLPVVVGIAGQVFGFQAN